MKNNYFIHTLALFLLSIGLSGCGIYSFKDAVIPDNIKTIKIGFIENKARYVNPQLAPQLTDKLLQKIISQTKRPDAKLTIVGRPKTSNRRHQT